MSIFVSPGVYVREVDLSRYLRNLSTTITAVVGTAQKGPINKATFISNLNSFVANFGSPHPDHLATYSAAQYLRYGRQLWFVRVNGVDATTASVGINGQATAAYIQSNSRPSGNYVFTDAGSATLLFADQGATVATIDSTNKNLKVQINGGAIVDIVLSEGSSVAKTAIATEIDTALAPYGADCAVAGTNQIQITTVATGGSTSIRQYYTANHAYTILGGPAPSVGSYLDYAGTDANRAFRITSLASGTPTSLTVTFTAGSRTITQVISDLNSAFTSGSFPATAVNYDGYIRITHSSTGQNYGLRVENDTAERKASAALIDLTANVVFYGSGLAPASSTMTVKALSAGAWGNTISVVSSAGSIAGTFKLTVKENGITVESFDNLVPTADLESIADGKLYFLNAVNGSGETSISRYIEIEDVLDNTGVPVYNTYALTGGTDGLDSLDDSDFIGVENNTGNTGLKIFQNAETYDINLLLCPGIHSAAVINEMISICETRGDCMTIIDPPLGLGVQQVVNWHNGSVTYNDHNTFDSSYAAIYWPWCEVYDSAYDRHVWTPPSGHAVAVYANSDDKTDAWFAPAGSARGRVLQVTRVEFDSDQGSRDLLYGGSNAVNPIVDFQGDGVMIWGQRTLQRKPTALDRVNVRRMLLYIRKVVSSSVRSLVFEPNDSVTWRSFVALVDPFMRGLQARRGIERYQIICDETTNTPDHIENNEMVARIVMQPIKSAEKIIVDAVLTPVGASFEEVIY